LLGKGDCPAGGTRIRNQKEPCLKLKTWKTVRNVPRLKNGRRTGSLGGSRWNQRREQKTSAGKKKDLGGGENALSGRKRSKGKGWRNKLSKKKGKPRKNQKRIVGSSRAAGGTSEGKTRR